MPVFNAERFIEQAVESILEQTYENLELLIIDDGSKDLTLEKISQFKDPRIKLITNKKNMGISKSLNKGIYASNGKYIARMDADDISLQDRIEKQCDFMEENPQIGILGTGYYGIDKNGGRKQTYIYPEDDIEIKWKLLMGPIFPHPTVMLRKKVLVDHKIYYNVKYPATQDYELWSQLIHYTEGTNLSLPLIEYRHHSESTSKSDSVIQENLRLQISAQSLTNLTKTRIISARHAAVFEKVVKYDFESLSVCELKQGCELFFLVLKKFYMHTHNSSISKLKWKNKLLFNLYSQFEKYIEKLFLIEKARKNVPKLEFLLLRIIQQSLRCMRVFLKPEQSIYYPSGIIVYSIQLMKRISKSTPNLFMR